MSLGMSPEATLLLALLLPFLSALLILAVGNAPNLRDGIGIAAGLATFALVVSLAPAVMDGARPEWVLAEPFPGLPLALRLEPLGLLFALVASLLWPVTVLYAVGYMRAHHEQRQTRFFAFFALSIGATLGLAFSANLLTLFLFYEALTLLTFPLVTHAGTDAARRAGRLYLGLLMGTSVGMFLLAILWTWVAAGTLDFVPGGILTDKLDRGVIGVLLALFVFGIGKAALMPFHRWLPAAMVAPTPVSALLHAVAVVKAGVFTVLKVVVYIFGVDLIGEGGAGAGAGEWLLYVAATSILLASLVAMTQDNLKARLAWSTISQLGYIVLGALLASSAGVIGGSMHIAAHAFGKITLFFCAGAILVAANKTQVSDLDGLGRAMPFTLSAFLIGALAIIGLPPTGGTWSKWMLGMGTLEAGHAFLLGVLLLSSLLNIAYLLPIPLRAFFAPAPAGSLVGVREAPLPCRLAIGFTSLGCVALFLYPEPLYRMAQAISLR